MANTLSLCVICKNEENNIPTLLESVKGNLFDEIIIVDTGSTDKTVEIVKKYTKKVYHFDWIDDFSAARNYSFSKATSDYLLWLDSDDYILPKDYQRLLDLKKRLHEYPMWLLKYEYAHDEYGNSTCSFYRERIVKRSLDIKWEQPIHEYMPLTSTYGKEDIEIQHNKKEIHASRNIRILRKVLEENPDNSRNVYYLGKELIDNGDSDGVEFLKKFVRMPDAWGENKYTAYLKLGSYYRGEGDFERAIKYFQEATSLEPLKAEAWCELGSIYLDNIKDPKKSIFYYKLVSLIPRPEEALDVIQPKYYTWLPHLQLCLAYNAAGMVEEAAAANERALSYLPNDSRMLNNQKIFKDSLGENYPQNPFDIKYYKKFEEVSSKQPACTPHFEGKLGWFWFDSEEDGSSRLRVKKINDYFKSLGLDSEIAEWVNLDKYDYIITKPDFTKNQITLLKELKEKGKFIFCDMNEDVVGWSYVNDLLSLSDAVICCSQKLREKVFKYNVATYVIEDCLDYIKE